MNPNSEMILKLMRGRKMNDHNPVRTVKVQCPFCSVFVIYSNLICDVPPLASALELLKNAIAKAGYTDKIVIGMDVAASEFYKGGKYDLDFKSPDDPSRYISADQLADLYKGFVKDYPGGKHFSRSSLLPPSGQTGELRAACTNNP